MISGEQPEKEREGRRRALAEPAPDILIPGWKKRENKTSM